MTILSFQGEYRFLSNFFPSPIPWTVERSGATVQVTANTVEHVYQAEKSITLDGAITVLEKKTPGAAKREGRMLDIRPDWEEIKFGIMLRALRLKFDDPSLRAALIQTGDRYLLEGNTWHDNIWGDCTCGRPTCDRGGENLLGKALMFVRDEIHGG